MSWVYLIVAGICEMLGVLCINRLNQQQNLKNTALFIASFGLSFLFLSMAMRTLPMGTAYAVWTGIGAAGGAVLGMILYGEPRSLLRILFIMMIIGAAAGLKFIG